MMHSLLAKTIYDKRWFMLGWGIALGFVAMITLTFYPSISHGDALEQLTKSLPSQLQAVKGLVGDPASFKTVSGYLSTQVFEIRIPLMILIAAVILAQGMTVAEEEKGTLRTLLATKLSRGRIVLEKWLAAVIITGIISLILVIATYLGLLFIGEGFSQQQLIWQLGLMTWLSGIAGVSLVFALGFASGLRSVTFTLSIVFVIGSFILTTFAKTVDWLTPYDNFSLLHYYDASGVAKNGLDATNITVLLLISLGSLAIATLLFRNRDVA
ncbi:MAG TPA: ABC transporter permease subunit [Candidatus Saccharimonadales bacterium]|jgi:ABC-2 type transport system permease protein|nr:ABC transporter permease subunit [Candidatus Saccharimonadales bacterium]